MTETQRPQQITIDLERSVVVLKGADGERSLPLATPEAFRWVSYAWLRAGWDVKYVYGFSWLGRPIIQLPEDMIRIQELVVRVQPDVIVETGIAHGGSLVFYAGLCKLLGKGRVVGVDIEIRPHNRAAIEAHPLASLITLIEGDGVAPATIDRVRACIAPGERVMVLLDSNHTKAHVLAELEAYGPLVSRDSYIVAMDGIMGLVVGGPRTQPDWATNNPTEAAKEFVRSHPEFVIEEPKPPFNEGMVSENVTYWPGGYLRRVG